MPLLDSAPRSAFLETVAQLREVFFVHTQGVERQVRGGETFVNRSLPIMTTATGFERALRNNDDNANNGDSGNADPRAIGPDLAHLPASKSAACGAVRRWCTLLERWGVLPAADTERERPEGPRGERTAYRLVVAAREPDGPAEVGDAGAARRALEREDAAWRDWLGFETKAQRRRRRFDGRRAAGLAGRWPWEETWRPARAPGRERERLRGEDLERAVRPAFGFWTFPLEALGPVEEASGLPPPDDHWPAEDEGRPVDWSGHWPGLALASLPPGPPKPGRSRRRKLVQNVTRGFG